MREIKNFILNFVIVSAIFVVGNFGYNQIKESYYRYADISNFYKAEQLTVVDVCIGDTSQLWTSVRFVKGTQNGYNAYLIREMYLINQGMTTKIIEEDANPFIEVINNGVNSRVQSIPGNLVEGNYRWVIYLTLYVHGVERSDIPPLVSNTFKVTDCHE